MNILKENKKKLILFLFIAILLSTALLVFGIFANNKNNATHLLATNSESNSEPTDTNISPSVKNIESTEVNDVPIFLQFYDWFHEYSWVEEEFVEPLDWEAIGIYGDDRSSEEFYYKQFEYIKSLGIDALSWEYHPRRGQSPLYPSENAIRALERSGLKIAPFYDLELTFKALYEDAEDVKATLSNPNAIRPDEETVKFISSQLKEFFDHIPQDLLARDKKGRQVIYVFGYGFDDSNPNPDAWSSFAENLIDSVKSFTIAEPAFYWTSKNSVFQEHLFLHYRNNFIPFHFVLDTPQSQFGHDSVTWNFGFDNLGVQKRDNLQRVVRLDPRYIQEMGWLAKATDPSAIFIYSWNEPFEDSMLIPTKNWGDTKARLAKEFIQRLRNGNDPVMPKTLLIVDDLSEYWDARKDDWHLVILREQLLYLLRRMAPQSDVRMVSEITPELLDQYSYIIDISSGKTEDVSTWLLQRMESSKIMVFDPLAAYNGGKLSSYFVQLGQSPNYNKEFDLGDGSGRFFVRDDVNEAQPCGSCDVKLTLKTDSGIIPLVVTREDDVWVNAYNTDERLFKTAFESLYGKTLNISIMYGEGLASQRLEIDPNTREITYNRLNRYSINGHWEIPDDIDWYKMPPEIGDEHFDFIFGIR